LGETLLQGAQLAAESLVVRLGVRQVSAQRRDGDLPVGDRGGAGAPAVLLGTLLDLGAQVVVGVDELARDAGLAGDGGDAQLLAGGQPRLGGRGDALALELAVQPPRRDHRLPSGAHPVPAAGRGTSVGCAGRVTPLKRSGIVTRSWARTRRVVAIAS